MTTPFTKALQLIDAAHSEDPKKVSLPRTEDKNKNNEEAQIPYELHYAQQMTKYLNLHTPNASEALQLAVRAQHLKRWEVPRTDYPATKVGYYAWRTYLGRRQAELAAQMCVEAGYDAETAERVAQLVRKEGLKKDDAETQALEDVACLVFLDDQLEGFQGGVDEEKVVDILRKTWGKMGERGKELALGMELEGRAKELVAIALG